MTELEQAICHYPLERIAELLSVHKRTVERLVERGQLAVTYVTPDAPRIAHTDLEAYLASVRRGGKRPARSRAVRRAPVIPARSQRLGPRPGRIARAA